MNFDCMKQCCCCMLCFSSANKQNANQKVTAKNIDKLEEIIHKVLSNTCSIDNNISRFDLLDRVNSGELCNWSNEVLCYFDIIKYKNNDNEIDTKIRILIESFKTIKAFYRMVQTTKLENHPNFQQFFDSIQLYEVVLSLGFEKFMENETILTELKDQIQKSMAVIDSFGNKPFLLSFRPLNAYYFNELDKLLKEIDARLSHFNLDQICDFILSISEVLCKYKQIDLESQMKSFKLFDLIQDLAIYFSQELKTDKYALTRRENNQNDQPKKWYLLNFTLVINSYLNLFNENRNAIERTIRSFERLYDSVDRFEVNFKATLEEIERLKKLPDLVKFEDKKMVSKNEYQLGAITAKTNYTNNFGHLNKIVQTIERYGEMLQQIEAYLIYSVLYIKDKEDILYPLSGHLDEFGRILDKYCSLHILFKLANGENYLKKLGLVMRRVLNVLEDADQRLKLKHYETDDIRMYASHLSDLILMLNGPNEEFETHVRKIAKEFIIQV